MIGFRVEDRRLEEVIVDPLQLRNRPFGFVREGWRPEDHQREAAEKSSHECVMCKRHATAATIVIPRVGVAMTWRERQRWVATALAGSRTGVSTAGSGANHPLENSRLSVGQRLVPILIVIVS